MMTRRASVALLALLLLIALSSPVAAYPRPGRTDQVSVAPSGKAADGFVVYPSISGDGRHVVFVSDAPNLVAGISPEGDHVFAHDRATRRTEIVSVRSDGTLPPGRSKIATVSDDGRSVAFDSTERLVPEDTGDHLDIYVRDRALDVTRRASVGHDGRQANADAGLHGLSGDGRVVVFESGATNLVPGDTNGADDIFVRDLAAGTTRRVSVTSTGAQANGRSHSPTISPNGRFIVFASYANNLAPGDTNGYQDTFIHDRLTGETELVSVAHDGALGTEYSSIGVTDDSGRFVAFESWAPNLVPADTGGIYDVFLRDRVARTTERISVPTEGAQANAASEFPDISADGRFVTFISGASNLVSGDTNGAADIFVRDLVTGSTERVSVTDAGGQANGGSLWWPSISADGAAVAFTSSASNLGEGGEQIYVRERGPAVGVGGLDLYDKSPGVAVDGWATFSGSVLVSGTDPAGDGTTTLGDVGGDLTGGRIAYQVEPENLAVRWDVASLPSTAGVAGLPGVVYGATFRVDGVRYEVRGSRVGATVVTPAAPGFALYRCDVVCTQSRALTGSVGTAGRHASAIVPVSAVGAGDGSRITEVRLFTGVGEAAPGPLSSLDEMTLPSDAIPARTVALGVADERVPADEVAFDIEVEQANGAFGDLVDLRGRDPERRYRLWARACLGSACGTRSVALPQ